MKQVPQIVGTLQAGSAEHGYNMGNWASDTKKTGQDFGLSRTRSGGNGCSTGMDLSEKCSYSSLTVLTLGFY
jgi:hypothetical protein